MGSYQFDDSMHEEKPAPAGERGIGCIMALLLPVISYVGAAELLKNVEDIRHAFYRISPSLFGAPNIPSFLWKIKSINPLVQEIYSWTDLGANLLLGLVILLVLSGVVGVVYAITYRAVAPPRYGRLDAPPSKRKSTKKSR